MEAVLLFFHLYAVLVSAVHASPLINILADTGTTATTTKVCRFRRFIAFNVAIYVFFSREVYLVQLSRNRPSTGLILPRVQPFLPEFCR